MANSRSKKILVIYTSVGLGHQVIAENIAQALRHHEEVDVAMCDVLKLYEGPFTRGFEKAYLWVFAHIPWLWGFFYTNRTFNLLTRPLRLFSLAISGKAKKLLPIVQKEKPDIILTTETIATASISYFKKKGLYRGPLVTTFSDYHFQPYWVYSGVNRYLGIIPEHEGNIRQWSDEKPDIVITGMPVDEVYLKKYNASEVARKYKLSKVKPLVLLMGGSRGWNIGPEDALELLKSELDIQVAVICGTNEELRKKFETAAAGQPDLHVVSGWSNDQVAELFAAARVLVTKPGGLTLAQALVRRLPLVLISPLPTMEEMNQTYLVTRGAAVAAKSREEMRKWVERLLRDPKFYAEMQAGEEKLGSPDAAEKAARAVIDMIEV